MPFEQRVAGAEFGENPRLGPCPIALPFGSPRVRRPRRGAEAARISAAKGMPEALENGASGRIGRRSVAACAGSARLRRAASNRESDSTMRMLGDDSIVAWQRGSALSAGPLPMARRRTRASATAPPRPRRGAAAPATRRSARRPRRRRGGRRRRLAAPALDARGNTPMEPPPVGMPSRRRLGFQHAVHADRRLRACGCTTSILMPMITVISLLVLCCCCGWSSAIAARANPVPSQDHHNTLIEIVWTLVPVLILVAIAVPSISLLAQQYKPAPEPRR